MEKCAACNSRKGKRNCPALGSLICSECCGVRREKEIDCPQDCFYLGKSKQYFTDRQDAQRISDFDREMKNIIGNEDHYYDILQNIEFIVHKIYIEKGNITDRDVEIALEYIIEMGKAQMDIPSKFLTRLAPNVQGIVDAIDDVLELRESFLEKEEHLLTKLKCIYRILDSVKTHYEPDDSCSYLDFISPFVR